MKNYLTLVLAVAVVSSPAFASRARLESLGEGKNGSYYIDDSRNMFLNPASIVRHKKKLMLELGGNESKNTTMTQDGATSALSRAQGGFTNTFGDFTYALYLNNTSDRAISTLGALLAPANALEFALAGEGSVNWGLSLLHGDNRSATTGVYYWGARFGVEKDALAVFGTLGLKSDAKSNAATPQEIKGNLSLDAAATYKMDNMTGFAHFTSTSSTVTNLAALGGAGGDVKSKNYGIGAGWKKEMTKSTNMFTRVSAEYVSTTYSNTAFNAISAQGAKWNLPLVLAAETQALSWLTVRSSIAHSLYGQDLNAHTGLAGTTTVSAGIGMTFGDLTVDGMIASNGANANAVSDLGFANGGNTKNDFGFGDAMISRIGMTYNF